MAAITNFPEGASSFGVPLAGNGIPTTTGKYRWVNSATGNSGGPGSAEQPFSTLNAAISASAANDVIIVAAGHAETISAAGGITASVAGVQIVGLGSGSQRPTFTFSTSTAATFLISGAGVTVRNIIGVCNIDQLITGFSVTGNSVTLGLPGAPVEWQDSATNKEAVVGVTVTGSKFNSTLTYKGQTGGSHCTAAFSLNGVATGVLNCDFYGKASTAWVNFVTTACTNIEVYGYMYNSGTTNFSKDVVDTVTGSTWFANVWDGAFGGAVSGGSAAALASDDVSSVLDVSEKVAVKAAATLTNAQTLFTVAGGPIQLVGLVSICVTGNDATASTLQYSATPTSGSAQTISGASASLASALAGASVTLAGTALATAALLNANGPNLIANPGTIMVPAGTITAVVGVGSTTGTWRHHIRYRPLASGVTVS